MQTHPFRKKLTGRIITAARNLRKESTPAEHRFWQLVRDRKLCGLRFYRQHPIEFELDGYRRFFIADFFCKERKLVVEIDGGVHENQKEHDACRDCIMEQLGIKVIRFTNEKVRFEIEEVLKKLTQLLTP